MSRTTLKGILIASFLFIIIVVVAAYIKQTQMTKTLATYRAELINNILFAPSQEEVKGICNGAVHDLEDRHLQGHLIIRFLEKTRSELAAFNPLDTGSLQWNNIITAKVMCTRLIQNHTFPHE